MEEHYQFKEIGRRLPDTHNTYRSRETTVTNHVIYFRTSSIQRGQIFMAHVGSVFQKLYLVSNLLKIVDVEEKSQHILLVCNLLRIMDGEEQSKHIYCHQKSVLIFHILDTSI